MANIYWIKGGADAHWDTHTGNWWDDAAAMDPAADGPQDGDYAYLTGATAPDNGPAVAVELIGLDTSGLADDVIITSDVTVTGSLVIGVPGGSEVHSWRGTGSTVNNALIQGASAAGPDGTIGKDAIFRDTALVTTAAVIDVGPRFYDAAGSKGGVFAVGSIHCYGVHTFIDSSGPITLTRVTFYVYGSLTINNTEANGIAGTPTVVAMNRNANSAIHILGVAVANVIMWRPSNAHRLRHLG